MDDATPPADDIPPARRASWMGWFCFELDHGVIRGKHLTTLHNCLLCRSSIAIDGKPFRTWWVTNPFLDVFRMEVEGATIHLTYRFFPAVTVAVAEGTATLAQARFPRQTRQLYVCGAALLVGFSLMFYLLRHLG
jgi:hypothetical protein